MLCLPRAASTARRMRGAGFLTENDWPRLARAAGTISRAPIVDSTTPGVLTVLELRAKCRRLKAEATRST